MVTNRIGPNVSVPTTLRQPDISQLCNVGHLDLTIPRIHPATEEQYWRQQQQQQQPAKE
jgi:hypothetical protein